jgi:hypothetical protein
MAALGAGHHQKVSGFEHLRRSRVVNVSNMNQKGGTKKEGSRRKLYLARMRRCTQKDKERVDGAATVKSHGGRGR